MAFKEAEKTQEQMERQIQKIIGFNTKENGPGIDKMFKVKFLSANLEEKSMCVEFPVLEWELNPQFTLHGGVVTAFFDTAFGFLVSYFFGRTYICTVDINTNYIKSAKEGDSIIISAKINSLGNTITTVYGEAKRKSDNVLIATSTATFMAVKSKTYVIEKGNLRVEAKEEEKNNG